MPKHIKSNSSLACHDEKGQKHCRVRTESPESKSSPSNGLIWSRGPRAGLDGGMGVGEISISRQ